MVVEGIVLVGEWEYWRQAGNGKLVDKEIVSEIAWGKGVLETNGRGGIRLHVGV
jgi:hypothetical protein